MGLIIVVLFDLLNVSRVILAHSLLYLGEKKTLQKYEDANEREEKKSPEKTFYHISRFTPKHFILVGLHLERLPSLYIQSLDYEAYD